MKRNPLKKFRTFWTKLNEEEQGDLWDILTALRGADTGDGMYTVKSYTTCRIRGELLKGVHDGHVYGALFADSEEEIKSCASFGGYESDSRKVMKLFLDSPVHFANHVQKAIVAILKYQEETAEDLKKFALR